MSEDYKVQVSLKFGPNQAGMLNLRGNTAQEVGMLADEAVDLLVGKVAPLVEEASALVSVGAQFPDSQVQVQPQQNNQPFSNNGGQMCKHGAMVYRSGNGNNGAWQGYFCPTQKGDPDKCKPRYQ